MLSQLPRPDDLIVESKKITQYLLCASHPDGSSKAQFFSALGFGAERWPLLGEALIQHGRRRYIVEQYDNQFGTKYVVECLLVTPDKRNPCIRSVWVVEPDIAPRLVTAYPA